MVLFVNNLCLYLDSPTPGPPSTKLAHCTNNYFETRMLTPHYLLARVRFREGFIYALPSNAIEESVQRSTEEPVS